MFRERDDRHNYENPLMTVTIEEKRAILAERERRRNVEE